MENIFTILEKNNIKIDDSVKENIEKDLKENYRTVNDYNMQVDKLKLANDSITETNKMFDEFKNKYNGIDPEELKKQINNLNNELLNTKNGYETKITDMTFHSKLSNIANKYKCIDIDSVKTKLDLDILKSSKNQDSDIENAFKTARDSYKYLFENQEPQPVANTNIISKIENANNTNDKTITMRQAMGLPIK